MILERVRTSLMILFLAVLSGESIAQNQDVIDSLILQLGMDLSDKDRVDTYVRLANLYGKKYDSAKTMQYGQKAVALADQIDYWEGKSTALDRMGWNIMLGGHYVESEIYFLEILKIGQEHNYVKGKADGYNGLGQVSSYLGNLEKALDYFLKSLRFREELNHEEGITVTHNNIGLIYSNRGDQEKAIHHYLKALEFRKKINDKRNIALASTNIGVAYQELGMYEKALEYQFEALKVAQEVDHIMVIAMAENNLGSVYIEVDQLALAVEHLLKSINAIEKMGGGSNKLYPLVALGRAYLKMGQLDQARKHLSQGLQYAQESGLAEYIAKGAEYLAIVEQQAGNFEAAYKAHVLFKQMADSLNNEDLTQKLTRIEAEYEFQKEKDSITFENEKQLLEQRADFEVKEQTAQFRYLMILFGAILILVIGFFIARYRLRTKALETRKLKEIGQFKEKMTGMIAHDLKNPLSVILNAETEKPSTRYMASQMLNLVNNMLDVQKFESTKTRLNLSSNPTGEIIAEAIENVRPLLSEKNIQIKQKSLESYRVKVDREYILRVFINLLTNAIKYSPNNGVIEIALSSVSGRIEVSITDQGSGIDKEDREKIFQEYQQVDSKASGKVKSTGLGLSFCKLALEAHGQQIVADSSDDGGARFTFTLPYDGEEFTADKEIVSKAFDIPQADREAILEVLPKLREIGLYNSIEIENTLAEVKIGREGNYWKESVIKAAYSHNQSYFDELLELIAKDNSTVQD